MDQLICLSFQKYAVLSVYEESVEFEDLDIAAAVAPACPTTPPVAPKTAVEVNELLIYF